MLHHEYNNKLQAQLQVKCTSNIHYLPTIYKPLIPTYWAVLYFLIKKYVVIYRPIQLLIEWRIYEEINNQHLKHKGDIIARYVIYLLIQITN